ncbi:MAG TPA: fused MFS/spermidine synthase [Bacteroidia bacterium]|nr:fused MFS/spermidine synthase [Bacteroidia bacterium]
MNDVFNRIASWFYPVRIDKVRGELGHSLEVNLYQGKLVLDTENVNYSYGSLQDVFDHAFTRTGLYDTHMTNALILGFGSGSVAGLLLEKCDPEIIITGVEADTEVIRLAMQYFPVARKSNVTIIHDDVTLFVRTHKNTYDLIVVDVFVEDRVPENCQERDFLQRVKKLLNANGKVYFNKMVETSRRNSPDPLEKQLRSVFGSVTDVHVHREGSGNHVYMCK